jgi:membrane fusion protein, multidrug efflux system
MRIVGFLLVLIAVHVSVGCKPREAPFAPPPPPEVTVAKPIVATLPQTLEFTGNTRGVETVDVRARVRGFIDQKFIRGGEKVKAGDMLFRIDPRPFEAAVGQAQATLASAEARLRLAQNTLDRKQQSAAGNAVSKLELDQAIAERDAAQADLDLAARRLDAARLDLEYTNVRAPFDGRIDITVETATGLGTVADIGQLVGEAGGPPLCRITNDSKIYVTFDVDETTILQVRRQFDYQRPGEEGRAPLLVYVGFKNDGDRYPYVGRYDAGDIGINAGTGTSRVEAIFDNSDGRMIPGAFARIKTVVGSESVTLVPDAAVSNDQIGRYVMVVNSENTVERVGIDVGNVVDRMRKISKGLTPEARVIVNGLQRARPGMVVKPTETTLQPPNPEIGIDQNTPAAQALLAQSAGAATQPTTAPASQPTHGATPDRP